MSSKTRQNLQSDIKRSRRLELVQRSKTGNFGTNSSSSIQSYGTTAGSNEKRRKRPASATRNRRLHTYDEEDRTMLNSKGSPDQIVGGDVLILTRIGRRSYLFPVSARPSQHNGSAASTIRSVQEGRSRRHFEDELAITKPLSGEWIGKMCPKRWLGRRSSSKRQGSFC